MTRAMDADDVPIGTVGEGLFVTSHNPDAPGTGTGTVALWQMSDTDPDPVWVDETVVADSPYYGIRNYAQNDGVSVEDRSFGWIDQTPGAHTMSQYNGIVATSSGVVTVGKYQPSTLQYAQVVKRDLSGNILWTITATGMTSSMEGVCELVNGDLLVTGHTNSSNGTLALGGQSVAITTSSPFVAKISPTGTVLWLIVNQTSGTGGTSIYAGLAPTIDGGAVVTGQLLKATTFAPLGSFAQAMCFAAKITSAGAWTWVATSSGTLLTNGQYYQRCVNDGFGGVWISASQSSGSVTLGGTTLSGVYSGTFHYVAHVNSSGTWVAAFNNEYGPATGCTSGGITKVGSDYYVVGSVTELPPYKRHAVIRRLSGSTVVWERTINETGSAGNANAGSVVPLSDGTGVAIAGDRWGGDITIGNTVVGDGSTGDSLYVATITVNGTWTGTWWSTVDHADGMAVLSGDIYLAGGLWGASTWGTTSITPNGTQDYYPGTAWVGKLDASVTTAYQNTIVAFTDKNGLGGGINLIVITYDGTFNVAVHDFPKGGESNSFSVDILVCQDGTQFLLQRYGTTGSAPYTSHTYGFDMTGTQLWDVGPASIWAEEAVAFPVANKYVRWYTSGINVSNPLEIYATSGVNRTLQVVDGPSGSVYGTYGDQVPHADNRVLADVGGAIYANPWQLGGDLIHYLGCGPAGFMIIYCLPGPPPSTSATLYFQHVTLSGNTLTAGPLNSVTTDWGYDDNDLPRTYFTAASWQSQVVVNPKLNSYDLASMSLCYVNSAGEFGLSETNMVVQYEWEVWAAGKQHTIQSTYAESPTTWDFWYAHQPFILDPLPEPAVPVWHKYWASDDA